MCKSPSQTQLCGVFEGHGTPISCASDAISVRPPSVQLFLFFYYLCNYLQEGQRPVPWLCRCCYSRVAPAPRKPGGPFESVMVDGSDSSGDRLSSTLTRTATSLGALSRTGRSSSTSSSVKGLSTSMELAHTGELEDLDDMERMEPVDGSWALPKEDGVMAFHSSVGDGIEVEEGIGIGSGGEGEMQGTGGHRRARGGSGSGGSGSGLVVPVVAVPNVYRQSSFPLKPISPVQRPGASPRPGALGAAQRYASFPRPGPLPSPQQDQILRQSGGLSPREGGQLRRKHSGSGLYTMDL